MAKTFELSHTTVVKMGALAIPTKEDGSRTRDLVARSILENGPSSATTLADRKSVV